MEAVEIKKLPESELEITGEISAGDFESCRQAAIKNLSEGVKIDGFRPGNAPEKILIDKIGEGTILEKMAEIALQKAYPKILEENKIQAIGRPLIDVTKIAKGNPLGFKIRTAAMPEIELPDYKAIAKKINEKEVEPQKKRMEILEVIIKGAKMEVPKILLEAEKDIKRTQAGLIFDKIAEIEKIAVSEEEVDGEAEKIIEHYKKAGQNLDAGRVKMYTHGILRNEKIFQLLEKC